jgi:hypothetical protein
MAIWITLLALLPLAPAHAVDQTLTRRNRVLQLESSGPSRMRLGGGGWSLGEPSIWMDPRPVPAPSSAPAQAPVEQEITLGFEGEAAPVVLGRVALDRGGSELRVPDALADEIQARFPHRIGELKAGDRVVGRVFVGGEHDRDCRTPVMIVDYNGTIDRGDACTRSTLDALMDRTNLVVFVVSTMGSDVSLRHLGFKHRERFLILENSGIGAEGSGEKAFRVARALWDSGACIIGFAGDAPEKEGTASRLLSIPYLAVNQQDRTLYSTEVQDVRTCQRTSPDETSPGGLFSSCPSGYSKVRYTEIECERQAWGPGIPGAMERVWIRRASETPQGGPPNIGSLHAECRRETGGNATGRTRGVDVCRNTQPDSIPARATGQPACDSGYRLVVTREARSVPVGQEPAFDIGAYPAGSRYARDWCELGRALNGTRGLN